MAPPRTRSTDDPAGQTSQVDDSATVTAVEPEAAPEATDVAAAPTAAEPEAASEQPTAPADHPIGRPSASEVAENAARGAFPDDAQEG